MAVPIFVVGLVTQAHAAAFDPARSWMDPELAPDARADLLDAQLTQDEELQLVHGFFGVKGGSIFAKGAPKEFQPQLRNTAGFVPGIPRLGIPPLVETDAGVGIADSGRVRPNDEATALTSGLAMAATWNPSLAFEAGSVVGNEARDRAFNVVLAGAMNLARDPRGGRTFEYVGEDPLLAGTMSGAEVAGVESAHVISTVKHFALNDQETGRFQFSANIGEAAARESDLLAFELAVEGGAPGAVMCAYNRVNGTYSCENDFLLNKVLKTDWHFPGWVLSDWGAVHSTVPAAEAGLDQESASGFDHKEYFGTPLAEAVANGELAPERLHDMVHRILREMFAKGLMDEPARVQKSDVSAHLAIAQQEAEEAIVLLKNENGALPLTKQIGSVAVIGSHADLGVLSGGGSSQVIPIGYAKSLEFPVGGAVVVLPGGARAMPTEGQVYDPPSPVAAIAGEAHQARIIFDNGENAAHAAQSARSADVAVVFAKQWMSEGHDVPSLSLGTQNALIEAVAAANPHTIVVLETGGPVVMPWLASVPAVVEAWYAGNRGANAIARVLFGDVNPSGKLPITFPANENQLPRPQLPGWNMGDAPFDVDYSIEGSDAGYRWFARKQETPLFPFGYGLSYTTFHVGNVTTQGGSTIAVTADVTNDGVVEGEETVQAYAAPPGDTEPEMLRLIGFSKVDLKPGQTRRIAITADPRLIADFDIECPCWHIDNDDYAVRVGTSSADLGPEIDVHLDEREIAP
ncbi:MAG TPA: glycoside hydrolase family 3 C-terminal domain-containing protein [Rhizomicrobium sp.]|nr:glycoside hydrolase family 3 C-terminal domain-containing protein [Rhizomicrobium sp.]